MTTQPEIKLPEPYGYYYEWDGPYGKRKFSMAPHNGNQCDRAVAYYTAEQVSAAVLADRAARADVSSMEEFIESQGNALVAMQEKLMDLLIGLRASPLLYLQSKEWLMALGEAIATQASRPAAPTQDRGADDE